MIPMVFPGPVTLVGGGVARSDMLARALALAPHLVAADGGANGLHALGLVPRAIIGDMDSLADRGAWGPCTQVLHLPEQETTDFEKCLYATEAPFYIGVGFTGGRIDHLLAVFSALLRRPEKTVVLLGEVEAMVLAPPGRRLEFAVTPGSVVSVYPLLPVRASFSQGLDWPIDGFDLAPSGRISTSNASAGGAVGLEFDGPGALVLAPAAALGALVAALVG